MAEKTSTRLAYIDWARGLACLVMFQTHCYDSWLGGAARKGRFLELSEIGGTLPAPLFLFLAGFSCALVTDKLRQKGIAANEIARATIRRGAEVFLLGLLFRLQEFLLAVGYSPWTDLLRVDILNTIGLSLVMLGFACRLADAIRLHDLRRLRTANVGVALAIAMLIAVVTPQMWTSWQPHWRAWWIESYINGVHTFGVPQPWLFPLFPWAAFAFAGLAVGFLLQFEWARANEVPAMLSIGAGGVALAFLGVWLDARPVQLYAAYDFWHTSPNFFLIRVGVVMFVLFVCYAWCRWGAGQRGFSPAIELGKSSLLVYWVHMQFVYGGLSILPKRMEGIPTATFGLLTISTAMTLLAVLRNRHQKRPGEFLAFFRRTARTSH
jgi:uncharacterized membrane protein